MSQPYVTMIFGPLNGAETIWFHLYITRKRTLATDAPYLGSAPSVGGLSCELVQLWTSSFDCFTYESVFHTRLSSVNTTQILLSCLLFISRHLNVGEIIEQEQNERVWRVQLGSNDTQIWIPSYLRAEWVSPIMTTVGTPGDLGKRTNQRFYILHRIQSFPAVTESLLTSLDRFKSQCFLKWLCTVTLVVMSLGSLTLKYYSVQNCKCSCHLLAMGLCL